MGWKLFDKRSALAINNILSVIFFPFCIYVHLLEMGLTTYHALREASMYQNAREAVFEFEKKNLLL